VADDDDNVLGEEEGGSAAVASSKYAARSSERSAVAAGNGREKMGRLMRLYERGVFLEVGGESTVPALPLEEAFWSTTDARLLCRLLRSDCFRGESDVRNFFRGGGGGGGGA
jgi:hypothetical protein